MQEVFGDGGEKGIMASSTERVTKAELVDMLKDYKDNDFVGVIFSVQDGKESPCHQVFVFYHAEDIC